MGTTCPVVERWSGRLVDDILDRGDQGVGRGENDAGRGRPEIHRLPEFGASYRSALQPSHALRRRGNGRAAIVPAMDDLGAPSSYLALEPGVYVFSRDGERLGEVQYVLADPEADLFDGIVVDTSGFPGGLRFADAPQVAEIYERGVILGLSSADAEQLPEPSENPGAIEVTGVEDVDRTELHEKLRRAWETITGQGLDKR